MKLKSLLAVLVMVVSSIATAEEVCGLLEVGMFKRELMVSIADMRSYHNKQVTYSVTNPKDFNWTAGSCLCVEGKTSYDPEYGTDYLAMQIEVTKTVDSAVFANGCGPVEPQALPAATRDPWEIGMPSRTIIQL